eukprot:74707_1
MRQNSAKWLRKERVIANCKRAVPLTATSCFRAAEHKYIGCSTHVKEILEERYLGFDFDNSAKTFLYHCYPEGIADRLSLTTKLCLIQWYFDDLQDSDSFVQKDKHASYADLKSIMYSFNDDHDNKYQFNAYESCGILNEFYNILNQLRTESDSSWFKRMMNDLIIRADLQGKKSTLSETDYINDYLSTRIYEGGMFFVYDLSEFVHDSYLQNLEQINECIPSMHSLRKYASAHFCTANDLHGYMKEIDDDQNLLNIIWKYKYQDDDTKFDNAILDSIDTTNNLFENVLSSMENVSQELNICMKTKTLPSSQIDVVAKYCESIKVICTAEHHWSKGKYGERYQDPNHFFIDLRGNHNN